jgi:hypothetical protein
MPGWNICGGNECEYSEARCAAAVPCAKRAP